MSRKDFFAHGKSHGKSGVASEVSRALVPISALLVLAAWQTTALQFL